MSVLRYVDIGAELTAAQPPKETEVHLAPGERIVSVETIKDHFGYSWMRVWIEASNQDTREDDQT